MSTSTGDPASVADFDAQVISGASQGVTTAAAVYAGLVAGTPAAGVDRQAW